MQPLRITHLIDSLQIGGAEVMLSCLAQLQKRQGHSVRVTCLLRSGPLEEPLRKAGIEVSQCRHNPLEGSLRAKLGAIADLRRKLQSWPTDILHCHNITPTLYGAPAAWLTGVGAVIVTRHGFMLRPERVRKEKIFWKVARGCSKVVAVSQSVAHNMSALPYARPAQIVTIRNGVLPPPVLSQPGPKTGFTVVTVARLAEPKDHSTLLRATALLQGEVPDLQVLVVGAGPMEEQLRSLAVELGITEHVKFLGDRRDVGTLLARSDVFALSSLSEGLPISMLEAMATGLPMVLSDVGGIRENVGHLPGVRLVAAGNPAELAGALADLSRNRGGLPRLGEANRQYFQTHYSADDMADAYASLYAECLADR